MVDYVSNPEVLLQHFRAFAFGTDVDPELAAKLQTIPGVAADVITNGAELLYAYRDTLSDEGLRVMGELFTYAHEQHWTTFNRDGRSQRIAQAVDLDLGERKTKPAGPEPEPEAQRRDGFDWRYPDGKPDEATESTNGEGPSPAEPVPADS